MKTFLKNERVKRRYLSWLRNAGGYCEATVAARERAIWRWEDFTQHSDFAEFCKSQAIRFKDWLLEREHNGRRISPISIYHTLRLLVFFFRWLSSQPGYRSKINWEDIAYLDPSRKLTRDALARKPIDYPTSDYVHRLTDSIGSDDELALRDRAMISTLFLRRSEKRSPGEPVSRMFESGNRDSASRSI